MIQATQLLADLLATLDSQNLNYRLDCEFKAPLEESLDPKDGEAHIVILGDALVGAVQTLADLCRGRDARLVQCEHYRFNAYRCVVAFAKNNGRHTFVAFHIVASRLARTFRTQIARLWRRWRRPAGMLVAIVGPDGSGKSSVAHAVDRRIHSAFRQTAIVHSRPGFLYPPERLTNRPATTRPRNAIHSFLRLLPFTADYCIGYFCSLRPQMVRAHGFLFDRYYDDLLVDPEHYQYGGSLGVAGLLRIFAARPDLWILLDAPAPTLRLRKQRLSHDELEQQRIAFRDVLSAESNVYIVDASKSLQCVIAETASVVLDRCEVKAFAMLGLPPRDATVASVLPTSSTNDRLASKWIVETDDDEEISVSAPHARSQRVHAQHLNR